MIVLLPNGMHFSPCYVYRKVECGYKDLKFFLFLVDLFHFYPFYEGSLVGGFWCSFVWLLGNMRVMESWSFLLFSTTRQRVFVDGLFQLKMWEFFLSEGVKIAIKGFSYNHNKYRKQIISLLNYYKTIFQFRAKS